MPSLQLSLGITSLRGHKMLGVICDWYHEKVGSEPSEMKPLSKFHSHVKNNLLGQVLRSS